MFQRALKLEITLKVFKKRMGKLLVIGVIVNIRQQSTSSKHGSLNELAIAI